MGILKKFYQSFFQYRFHFEKEKRVAEAKRLGYKNCVMPAANADAVKGVTGINIIAVSNIKEAVNELYKK